MLSQHEIDRIESLCREYGINDYSINNDGSIDVQGNVSMGSYTLIDHNNIEHRITRSLTELPLDFNIVTGVFSCNAIGLTTLKGCPKHVGASFYCNHNKLSSLEYAPLTVGRNFYCNSNELTSFKGCPPIIPGEFCGTDNLIESLDGLPTRVDYDLMLGILSNIPNEIRYFLTCPSRDEDEIKVFYKYQHYYGVWDNGFNENNFNTLLTEIEEGLL